MDQLCAACGTPGGPDTAALLQTNAVLGDYAGTDTLQAAMGMLPMFGHSRLALALRAAGVGADGQGIVLAPPAFTAQYLPVRRFLAMALGQAKQRCASYHIWAALPLPPAPDGEELCAQYLASGLTLRAVVPLDSQQLLVFAAHTPVGRVWSREELLQVGRICQRHGVTILRGDTSLDLTGRAFGMDFAAEAELRQIYLKARYNGTATAEDAARAAELVRKICS